MALSCSWSGLEGPRWIVSHSWLFDWNAWMADLAGFPVLLHVVSWNVHVIFLAEQPLRV